MNNTWVYLAVVLASSLSYGRPIALVQGHKIVIAHDDNGPVMTYKMCVAKIEPFEESGRYVLQVNDFKYPGKLWLLADRTIKEKNIFDIICSTDEFGYKRYWYTGYRPSPFSIKWPIDEGYASGRIMIVQDSDLLALDAQELAEDTSEQAYE